MTSFIAGLRYCLKLCPAPSQRSSGFFICQNIPLLLTLIQMKGKEKALMGYIRMILNLTVSEMSNRMRDPAGLVFVVSD
jgi:hypothetical protein